MSLFHRHAWTETERFYAAPVAVKAERCSERVAERFYFGVTTIMLTCAGCGDKKTAEVLGVTVGAVDPHGDAPADGLTTRD